jgi:hypothetical protein
LLKDLELIDIFNREWRNYEDDKEKSGMFQFNYNLKRVNGLATQWENKKYKYSQSQSVSVEKDISRVYNNHTTYIFYEERESLKELEASKKEFLKWEESRWSHKSREVWLAQGGEKTKIFHNCAKARKISNIIWNILNENREMVSKFQDIGVFGVGHFQICFKNLDKSNIA